MELLWCRGGVRVAGWWFGLPWKKYCSHINEISRVLVGGDLWESRLVVCFWWYLRSDLCMQWSNYLSWDVVCVLVLLVAACVERNWCSWFRFGTGFLVASGEVFVIEWWRRRSGGVSASCCWCEWRGKEAADGRWWWWWEVKLLALRTAWLVGRWWWDWSWSDWLACCGGGGEESGGEAAGWLVGVLVSSPCVHLDGHAPWRLTCSATPPSLTLTPSTTHTHSVHFLRSLPRSLPQWSIHAAPSLPQPLFLLLFRELILLPHPLRNLTSLRNTTNSTRPLNSATLLRLPHTHPQLQPLMLHIYCHQSIFYCPSKSLSNIISLFTHTHSPKCVPFFLYTPLKRVLSLVPLNLHIYFFTFLLCMCSWPTPTYCVPSMPLFHIPIIPFLNPTSPSYPSLPSFPMTYTPGLLPSPILSHSFLVWLLQLFVFLYFFRWTVIYVLWYP